MPAGVTTLGAVRTDEKPCLRCRRVLPLDAFAPKSKKSPNRKRASCRECACKHHEWAAREPAKRQDRHLRRTYGITLARRDEILAEQGGVCAVCRSESPGSRKGWHVDHCHVSGRVRGILCHRCNTLLGAFEADPWLSAAVTTYLTGGMS